MTTCRSVSFTMAGAKETYTATMETKQPEGKDIVPADKGGSTFLLGFECDPEEAKILEPLLDDEAEISVLIPDEIDPGQLWDCLDVSCRILSKMQKAASRLKPLVGRMLVVIQGHPEIYLEKGYKDYNDFISRGMKELLGISRAEAFHCKRIAKNIPWLTIAEFNEVGIAALEQIARDEVAPRARELIEIAKQPGITVAALKQIITDGTPNMETGSLDYSNIIIAVPRPIRKQWRDFVGDASVQAYCGSSSEASIFEAMLQECSGTWKAQGQVMLNQ